MCIKLQSLIIAFCLLAMTTIVHAEPPVLMTSSFMKNKHTLAQCQQKAIEIMTKMNLEKEDHGNGTIVGYGEQSVASVDCHQIDNNLFVQLSVASQKQEAAETIMYYLMNYLRNMDVTESVPATTDTSKTK